MYDKKLTARQAEVLKFVKDNVYIGTPAYREIAKHFGITLKAIADHLGAIEKKGYIRKTGRHRGIEIL